MDVLLTFLIIKISLPFKAKTTMILQKNIIHSIILYFSRQVASIHDHSNNVRTVGMGEVIAVLNGVEFRTRHNDYRLNMPHRTSRKYNAFEPIPFPEVPPEVTRRPNNIPAQVWKLN